MRGLDTRGNLEEFEEALRFAFRDKDLLRLSLVHSSFLNEAPEAVPESNERLEFLGDAVLGLIVSEKLYHDNPEMSEGQLSQIRSLLVRLDTLAGAAERIGLGQRLALGRGEEMSGGRERPSNLASGLEAVIAAVFLDAGLEAAREVMLELLRPDFEQVEGRGAAVDSKTELQHRVQRRWHHAPRYRLVASEGPDHARVFTVEVLVEDRVVGSGQGASKKQAELNAARHALESLEPE